MARIITIAIIIDCSDGYNITSIVLDLLKNQIGHHH